MSLATSINLKPRKGWIRAPDSTDTDIAQVLSNLTAENARLRKELDSLKSADARTGDTKTIVAALERSEVRRRLAGGTEITMDGIELFPKLAKSFHMQESMEQVLPGLDKTDVKEFIRNLSMMGLIEKQLRSSDQITRLTALGGIVYARLIGQPGS
jgi:hypothetical protein